MKEYTKIAEFCYKNNIFNMYLDSKNKHYFLKQTGNKLTYPTFGELIELSIIFTDIPVQCIQDSNKNEKMKIVPKIIIGGVAVTLSLSMITVGIGINNSYKRIEEIENSHPRETKVIDYISYADNEKTEKKDLEVDTYLESDWLKYKYIYDMDYLEKVFDYDNVSINEIKDVISKNNNISEQYKKLLYEYCDAVISKYPNIELRVFYANLKTLEIIECSKSELIKHTLSAGAFACYVRSENKIYVQEGYDYQYGTWAYQVIFHEFSHCLRTRMYENEKERVRIQVEGQNFNNTITAEALNSLFTVSLFNYEEKDVAYQLQSNYYSVMLDSMNNYDLEDYIKHSLSYFAKKLDEFNNDQNYATTILELIQLQYKDFHSDSIALEQSAYYPIYDYISNMYFKTHITKEMTSDEAMTVYNQLVDKVTYDVPEEYNIDINRFKNNFESYCNVVGIVLNVKSR